MPKRLLSLKLCLFCIALIIVVFVAGCGGGGAGKDPDDVDNDGDGYTENQGDCNDADDGICPDATEICGDGIDQDCSGDDLECPKVTGRVLLGPIVNGTVRFYKYQNPGTVLWNGTTSNSSDLVRAGLIELPGSLVDTIDDDALYYIEVDGGEDIDADDDGVLDTTPTPVLGELHFIAPGRYFKVNGEAGSYGFIVSYLSEMVYRMACFDGVGTADESVIASRIANAIAGWLNDDINGDGTIDFGDVAVWNPLTDKDSLGFSDTFLTAIVERIHAGSAIVATITATAGEGSTISPSGESPFFCGTSMSYLLHTDGNSSCIQEVLVDGFPVQWDGSCAFGSYTFENISAPHTIHVTSQNYIFGRPDLEHFEDEGTAEGIFVAEGYAYIADGAGGLKILDVSNPAEPFLLGGTDTPGNSQDVIVVGNYAYIADGEGGLQIVDISDHEHPERLSGISPPDDNAIGVQVSDGYAYIAADHYVEKYYGKACGEGVLQVIDVRNPDIPALAGRVSLDDSSCYLKSICVSKGVAYVVSKWGGLYIIDIADPANPMIVSHPSIPTPEHFTSATVNGDHAYLLTNASIPSDKGGGKRLLYTINIQNPANPLITGSVALGESPEDISVYGEYAYVAGWSPAFQKIDISDPANPFVAGSLLPSGGASDFCIADGYGYAVQDSEIVIIDMRIW